MVEESKVFKFKQEDKGAAHVVEGPEPCRLIVIMGENGQGKSSLGNCLLDKDCFKVNPLSGDCTKMPVMESCIFEGNKYYVLDTPGFNFQMEDYEKADIKERIQVALLQNDPGSRLTQIDCLMLVHK